MKKLKILSFLRNHFKNTFLRYLYESGAEVNGKDKYGLTPLHYACMRGIVLQIVMSAFELAYSCIVSIIYG